jgi:hypothetical protein
VLLITPKSSNLRLSHRGRLPEDFLSAKAAGFAEGVDAAVLL